MLQPSKVITAAEAAALVKSGDAVTCAGFVGTGTPDELFIALEERFKSQGEPTSVDHDYQFLRSLPLSDLTLFFAAGQGDGKGQGLDRLSDSVLLKRVIGSHFGLAPRLGQLILANLVEAYNLPQGCLCHLFRAIANHQPGVVSRVGLGTYVDPRNGGGKLNAITTQDIVHLVNLGGEEYIWYERPPRLDIALIRGTTADFEGNISMEREALTLDTLNIAMAVRNSGGIVICQVERISKNPLHARLVKIPGHLVDHIVVAKPSNHWQTYAQQYNPGLSGELQVHEIAPSPMRMTERKIIARRAALQLKLGAVVNLGIGLPEGVAKIASEEHVLPFLTLTTEAGAIGGQPSSGVEFGTSVNLRAMVDQASQFDFYDGVSGGADVALLGMGQADALGNVNVSRLGGKLTGCGGFINITQNSKEVVFLGTFTAGGLRVHVKDGKLRIDEEGREKKFVRLVDHVTFSAAQSVKDHQTILYITERCVFRLLPKEGLEVIEIAPGIDLERDIIAHMGFAPRVAVQLKTMESAIFEDSPLQLQSRLPHLKRGTCSIPMCTVRRCSRLSQLVC